MSEKVIGHILVTGGSTKEPIDGVRHYASHARPENHGLEAARLLAARGILHRTFQEMMGADGPPADTHPGGQEWH